VLDGAVRPLCACGCLRAADEEAEVGVDEEAEVGVDASSPPLSDTERVPLLDDSADVVGVVVVVVA
jgi:hypothetical protein